MTTATRRLRRASIAGLATIATGIAVVASGGTALAYVAGTSTVAAVTTTAGSVPLTVGASNQALDNVTLTFPANGSAEEYLAGQQITYTIGSASGSPAINVLTGTAFNTASFSAAPTITVDNGVTAPGATVALASSGSGTNNAFVVTFLANAPENASTTDFTISGLKLNLGSTVTTGETLTLTAVATTPTGQHPFYTGGAASDTSAVLTVGSIAQASLAVSKVAVAAPSATGVTLGNITITDAVGGTLQAGDVLHLTLGSGTFTTLPTATGAPALAAAPSGTGTATLAFTVGSTASVAGNVLTLTGAEITFPGTAGPVVATLTDTSHAFGINPTVQVATALTQGRIGGIDRYSTGQLLYSPTFGTGAGGATSVVLTSGTNFPDALSAQFLAKQLSTTTGLATGVLTTDPNVLSPETQQQLIQHSTTFTGISTVYIVGGTAAVSQNVQNAVAALHVAGNSSNSTINVIRIAGADRYATNSAVDLYSGVTSPGVAYVATGDNFADALAIGPVIYKTGAPLVLTSGTALSASAASTLQNLGVGSVIIVGGTAAVSTADETAITALGITVKYRIAGADRTVTAQDVATYETSSSATALAASGTYPALAGLGSFSVSTVYLARGDSFADALVAGPVAGSLSHPILLTTSPTSVGVGAPAFLGGTTSGAVTTLTALGLDSAISAATLTAAGGSVA